MKMVMFAVPVAAIGAFAMTLGNDISKADPENAAVLASANNSRSFSVTLTHLIEVMPDGSDLKERYRAVRKVSHLQEANSQATEQVARVRASASELLRLRSTAVNSCDVAQQLRAELPNIEAISNKAHSFRDTMSAIDFEMRKSLPKMRKMRDAQPPGRAASELEKAVLQYEELHHTFGSIRTLAEEAIGQINSASFASVVGGCEPPEIPPLFGPEPITKKSATSEDRLNFNPPIPPKRRMPATLKPRCHPDQWGTTGTSDTSPSQSACRR